jgi:hypothetical protein
MRFEVSETINGCDPESALSLLEMQLRKISGQVARSGQSITATRIEASFGSINRSSTAVCSARSNGSRGILTADVEYRPSLAFWIFFIMGLFTMLGWLIPLVFYILQKSTVRSAIEAAFRRVKTECEFNDFEPVTRPVSNYRGSQPQNADFSPSVVQTSQFGSLDQTIATSYSVLGVPIGSDKKTAEEAYLRLSQENDPATLTNFSKEIQDLAKSRTMELRVAYTFVTAHLATRG